MKIFRKGWFYFLLILGLIALNQFVFNYFLKVSYFEWYLANSSLIGAVTVLVTFVWDVNKVKGLISVNPLDYLGSYMQLIGVQLYAFGTIGKSDQRKKNPIPLLDMMVYIPFSLLMILVFSLWTLVVVPIQYFLVLFLGAPGRIYLSSPVRPYARFSGVKLEIDEVPRNEQKPADWFEVSVASKPVSFTYALIALVMALVKFLMR